MFTREHVRLLVERGLRIYVAQSLNRRQQDVKRVAEAAHIRGAANAVDHTHLIL